MWCEGINGTSEWRLASDAAPITHHEKSLFNSSMYGNNKYNIAVRIDHKFYYFSIEVKNYTLPSIDALKAKLAEAKAIKADGYTEESYAELQAVIKSASLTVSMNQKKLWNADQKSSIPDCRTGTGNRTADFGRRRSRQAAVGGKNSRKPRRIMRA